MHQMGEIMTNTEWLLVGQAKEGDAHAFALLYEKYYKDLYYFALSYMGNETAAEDAVSAGILKAYEKLPMLRKNDSFKSWLFHIVANTCKDSLSERKRMMPVDFSDPLESGIKVQETRENGYELSEWDEILSMLSERERMVITLTVFSDYSSAEAAKILGLRAGSVRSLKSRGLMKLKQVLS